MADTYTTNLQLTQPATGAYDNTWGEVLNEQDFQELDDAIAGSYTFSIGSATTYSLPAMTQGASGSGTRMFEMIFTGTPSGPVTATFPGSILTKFYLINNQTGQPITFTYGSSANTVTVADSELRLIWVDGTDTWNVLAEATDTTSMAGVPYTYWARVAQDPADVLAGNYPQNTYDGVTECFPWVTVTEAATTHINCELGNYQQLTLTGNRILAAPTTPVDGFTLKLIVQQDSTGSRTLTWNAVFQFPNGAVPILTTTPNAIDLFTMTYNAGVSKWLVTYTLGITSPSGASYSFAINQNVMNWNLAAMVGSVGSAITVSITVAQGVIVQSLDTVTPAMDLSGLPSGSTVNLINNGYIIGKGGDGADGAQAEYPGSGSTNLNAGNAGDGGNAITGPGSSHTFNITNGAGNIWAGGGGGGGGGAYDGLSSTGSASAGGGGGGAGGGKGGKGGRAVYGGGGAVNATDGAGGISGPSGAGGAVGSGTSNGAGEAGDSGAGGDYGADGTTGANPGTTTTGHFGVFSAGGSAGKAIELLGAGAPTFISGGSSPHVKGAVS